MRRMIAVLAVGLMAATLTAGVAGASPATKTENRARHWYAVAGERRTEASAKELLAKVEKKHFEGFGIQTRRVRHGLGHVRRMEVERMFPDRKAAQAEVKRLREAGFGARTAHERG
jgi:hypothetical protein